MVITAFSNGFKGESDSGAKIVAFLCSMLNLESDGNTDNLKLISLTTVNTILESFGHLLHSKQQVLSFIQDQLCFSLLEVRFFPFLFFFENSFNFRSFPKKNLKSNNYLVFTMTLRVFFNLFVQLKGSLKLQMELFFNKLLEWVLCENVLYQKQEIAIQSIVEFCRQPSFMVEIFLAFDCEIGFSDLFENICKVLYKNSFPVEGQIYSLQVLALEGLMAIAQSISERLEKKQLEQQLEQDQEEIKEKKKRKRTLQEAVKCWNEDPKKGIEHLKGKSEKLSNLFPLLFSHTNSFSKKKREGDSRERERQANCSISFQLPRS